MLTQNLVYSRDRLAMLGIIAGGISYALTGNLIFGVI